MKKQISEVKNYFLNQITACDFKIITLRNGGNGPHFGQFPLSQSKPAIFIGSVTTFVYTNVM